MLPEFCKLGMVRHLGVTTSPTEENRKQSPGVEGSTHKPRGPLPARSRPGEIRFQPGHKKMHTLSAPSGCPGDLDSCQLGSNTSWR